MRIARTLMLPVLALGLVLAASLSARADLAYDENASVSYAPGLKQWQFVSSFGGRAINIVDKSMVSKLAKLDKSFSHICIIEFETDSKIMANNGDFYSVFALKKCDR